MKLTGLLHFLGRFVFTKEGLLRNYLKISTSLLVHNFRLFELNFQEQLGQILARLPESRQTLLFSATLPKMLVEFASAGLNSPELIRLDVDTKLSDQLSVSFEAFMQEMI